MKFFLGIQDGQTVRMAVGQKELFITFRVEKSNYFKRDGSDVYTEADISIAQAILGGTIRIQGVYEDHTIQVWEFANAGYSVFPSIIFLGYTRHIFSH